MKIKNELVDKVAKIEKYVGILEIKKNNQRQIATGFLLFFNDTWVVITAAHCVYDPYTDEYNDEFSLITKKNNFKLKTAYVHEKWIRQKILEYDVAIFTLSDSFLIEEERNDDKVVPAFSIDKIDQYAVIGFPMLNYLLKKPYICYSAPIDDKKYDSFLVGVHTRKKGGMSGGPWFTLVNGNLVINSTTSLSFNSSKRSLWGTFWDHEIEKLLIQATGANQYGEVHEKNFSPNKLLGGSAWI